MASTYTPKPFTDCLSEVRECRDNQGAYPDQRDMAIMGELDWMKLLGSIHTHPLEYGTKPSDDDIHEAEDEGEIVWGIYAIRKTAKRRFVSCRFYSNSHGETELVISEG